MQLKKGNIIAFKRYGIKEKNIMDAILRAVLESDFAKSIARTSGDALGNLLLPVVQMLLPLLGF